VKTVQQQPNAEKVLTAACYWTLRKRIYPCSMFV